MKDADALSNRAAALAYLKQYVVCIRLAPDAGLDALSDHELEQMARVVRQVEEDTQQHPPLDKSPDS